MTGHRRARAPFLEARGNDLLERLPVQQLNGVDAPLLPEAIDASDPLLERQRVPWQLEVHDQTAARLQVQTLTGGVGRHQCPRAALRECGELVSALGGRESAVEHGDSRQVGDSRA